MGRSAAGGWLGVRAVMDRIRSTRLWASLISSVRVTRFRARKGSEEQRMKQARKRAADLCERGEMPKPP